MSQISATYIIIGERIEKKIIHFMHAHKYAYMKTQEGKNKETDDAV